MSELPDRFISALLRDGAAGTVDLNVDLDIAYAGVTRRVQHVGRRRVALVSGAACVALFGAVVFAGSRMGTSDDGQPSSPATDNRGNLIPDSSDVTTTTAPPAATVEPTTNTATVPLATAPPQTVVVAPQTPAARGSGGSPATTPSNKSGNGGGPSTTDDQGDHGGPDTTDDGLHGGGRDDGSGGYHGG